MESQQTETGSAAAQGASKQPYKPLYRNYVLALLFLGYAFNAVDRGILGLLVEPIRHEFNATDTQLGLLGGVAFAIFYSFFGIPIAAWADRSNRKNILSLAIFLWSGMTALCGAAVNFIMLVFTRIGTAVGEAGGTPPSHSLIADYFPLSKRATAISIYMTAIPVGTMLGSLLGGWAVRSIRSQNGFGFITPVSVTCLQVHVATQILPSSQPGQCPPCPGFLRRCHL